MIAGACSYMKLIVKHDLFFIIKYTVHSTQQKRLKTLISKIVKYKAMHTVGLLPL